MKYLKKFDTEGEVFMVNMPNVVLVGDTNKVLYNVDSSGVYIQHIDGSLYKKDAWVAKGFTKEDANGVAIVDKIASFVIAKKTVSSYTRWSNRYDELDNGVFTTTIKEDALTDYAGQNNTDIISANNSEGAAKLCANYIFPNGKKGYLPSVGEIKILLKYVTDVKQASSVLGSSPIIGSSSSYWWTSTQASASTAWIFDDNNNDFITKSKSAQKVVGPGNDLYVIPFTAL